MKVFFLQAYRQLDYVKIVKYKTEEVLSDSLTKVMTTPKHHLQKCGLRDLQVAISATVVAFNFAVAAAQDEDKHPGAEWFVLKAAAVLFLVGLFKGMILAKMLAS